MKNLSNATASRRHRALTIAAISAVFALTVLCYWPSLSGPFLFDDIPNLELLGDRGGLSSLDTYLEFMASAQSGPLGRPLSLISFTLDGQTWPTEARPFRVTNLIIHLVNGLLVFLLARSILATAYDRETAAKLAIACMALWILHPLLVSTTAYIIQRMTQLASLFILAGLLCYVHGRKKLASEPKHGWVWIVAGMSASGALAVLSKEIGILLPFYALAIELTVFSTVALEPRQRRGLITLLCVPVMAVLFYFVINWDALQLGFEFRPYSMRERLLTQAVVLFEYLHQTFAPHLSGLGIIHDDFPVSRGLFRPPATFISLVGLMFLVAFAIWCRRKLPFVALGIVWFVAGHSLEAGPLALELYFDHRNYLPLFGPLLALCALLPLLPGIFRRIAPVVLALFLCLEMFLTWQSARLWSDEDLMMQVASVDHPVSLRVQQHVANKYIYDRNYAKALEVQQSIVSTHPNHTSTHLSILNLQCILATLTPEQVAATRSYLERGRHDVQIIGFFAPLLSNAIEDTCPAFSLADFQATLDAVLRNPVIGDNPKTRGAAHYFKGLAYEREGRFDQAIEQLDLSYDAWPEIDVRLRQVVWFLARGRADDAERYLDLARQYNAERFWRSRLREADLQTLQKRIDQARRQQ